MMKVAIIGRPNVGKSTLFNRLVGKRLALVDDRPGVTRDRREAVGRLGDIEFEIVDTAGLEQAGPEDLAARMQAQTEIALEDADVVLFLIDARAGVTPLDEHFATWLRPRDKPVVLVANKAESRAAEAGVLDAYSLGLGEPVVISAEHGEGLAELYDALRGHADAVEAERPDGEKDAALHLAVVGRPNAGKSTLVNALIGADRLVTGPEAGITRDAIAIDWRWKDQPVKLYDTAGLRRRARVTEKLERLAAADAKRAIDFAEVVVLLIDATLGIEAQDLKIAAQVLEEGRALVLALNKWDLIEDRQAAFRAARDVVERSLAQAKGVALVPVSAATGEGRDKLMTQVLAAHARWDKRVPTAQLNRWLRAAVDAVPPPSVKGKRVKLRYVAQVKSRPPTFTFFVNRPAATTEAYRRYLMNALREDFDFPGVPLRLNFKAGENPYA